MKCIILAAGYATRLYPLTENFPKPLLEVKGKSIMDWLIDDIDTANAVEEYLVISNHKFVTHFEEWAKNKKAKANIKVIDDGTTSNENRLGAVADIELVIETFGLQDDVMVIAGDNVLDFSLAKFIKYFEEKKNTCVMRYFEENTEKIKKSSAITCDESDLVLKMVEKPEKPDSNWCCPAFYIYEKEDVKKVKEALDSGCPKDAPGSFINWLYSRSKVYAMKMPGSRYDIGNLESYKIVCENYQGIVL